MIELPAEHKSALTALAIFGYIAKGKKLDQIDAEIARAISRFQRHAARPYRLPQDTPNVFHGKASGTLDTATLEEIGKWQQQKWKLPLGRFPLLKLPQGGKLRSDAAAAWSGIVSKVTGAGGTLDGPYGDTTRSFDFKAGAGASRHSFHYAGRAVDVQQALAGGRNQRYYVDLSKLIEAGGQFERIRAQDGWEGNSKKQEWWHFQYCIDKQATIQDEMELIGISEAQLKQAGWLDKDLDHAPG